VFAHPKKATTPTLPPPTSQYLSGAHAAQLFLAPKCRNNAPHHTTPAANWAISHVLALPELWAIVAEHSGVVEAWRLTGVCVAARVGAKEWLRTLPELVVCGGSITGGEAEITSDVWRLDLGELRWERTPDLTLGRAQQACCAVRGGVVVLGGLLEAEDGESQSEEAPVELTASVEILGFDSEAGESIFVLPPLSCGPNQGSVALAIEESESELEQVLLIGGFNEDGTPSSAVHRVDLATAPQPLLLSQQGRLVGCSAARLADGRIVCVGRNIDGDFDGTAQVLEPPEQGSSSEASWQWRYLPDIGVERYFDRGCVLSDGRFAALGGRDNDGAITAACEALPMDGNNER
jgi:hypothetical protein